MGTQKRKRGRRGGKQAFLKALKKELHSAGTFDPVAAFSTPRVEETPPPPKPELPPKAHHAIPRRQNYIKKSPAKAKNTFVPGRVPTQPLPISLYARKPPSALPVKLRVKQNVQTHYKVSKTAAGDFIIRRPERNEGEPTELSFENFFIN